MGKDTMTPITLTATPPISPSLDDGAEHQTDETRTPETRYVGPRDENDHALTEFGRALDALFGLEPDWDSYGALPPSRLTLQYVWSLASALVERGMPIPQVFPTRSGGLQLEWQRPSASLEWEIDGNLSTGVFIFDDHRTGERIDGELPADLGLLAQALSRIPVA
jgi:hypothetical protein